MMSPSQKARLTVAADQPQGPPISHALFGKFTEHLGSNVYGGAWAQLIENPWFAGKGMWPKPDVLDARLKQLVEDYRQLNDWVTAGEVPYWWTDLTANCRLTRGLRGEALQLLDMNQSARLAAPVFLPIHRQCSYRLQIRARSSQITKMTVQLATLAGSPLTKQELMVKPGLWQTMGATFRLTKDRDLETGTPVLLILTVEPHVTVWFDRCSLRPADHRHGWDTEVIAWMRKVQLPLLRFPGGNFASGYHWEDGIGPPEDRPILPNPAWPEVEWNEVGTDDWLRLCELVGCEPLICINAGSGTPAEAARWVEYCNAPITAPMGALRATNGHPEPYQVRRWEIGNELYGTWQIGHATVKDYASRYLAFRSAMLAVDPDLNIVANGHDPDWNKALVEQAGTAVQSLSVHTLVGKSIPSDADPEAVYREYMGFAAAYEVHLDELAESMRDAGLTPKLAITELSIFTLKSHLPNVDNLSEAIYYTGIVNTAIRGRGLVELITHSALVNHSGGLAKERGRVYPHPLWWALYLYGTQQGRIPLELIGEYGTLSCSSQWLSPTKPAPVLDAVALIDENKTQIAVMLTNRHPRDKMDLEVTVTGNNISSRGRLWSLSGESFMDKNTFDAPDKVSVQKSTVTRKDGSFALTLPPHSVNRLDVSLILNQNFNRK